MCFETTKTARAKIAKTDIECWKLMFRRAGKLESSVQGYRYIKSKLQPPIHLVKSKTWSNDYIINKGYHSFKNKTNALQSGLCGHLYKFCIPAGTRYYSNYTEYVSETIMLIE